MCLTGKDHFIEFGVPAKQGPIDVRYEYSAMLHIAGGEREE